MAYQVAEHLVEKYPEKMIWNLPKSELKSSLICICGQRKSSSSKFEGNHPAFD
jgi:hypothetical protein